MNLNSSQIWLAVDGRLYLKFKETMGETPSQYIIKERIKPARERLHSGMENIT